MTDVASGPGIRACTGVKPINHWISGQAYAGQSGRSGPVFNPATGEQSGAVDFATVEEVDKAVQAAKQAFPAWRATSLAKRAELFFTIRELFPSQPEENAKFLTRVHRKVLSGPMGEVTHRLEETECPLR